MLNACSFFCSKHSLWIAKGGKIDEAALWELLLFLSIFDLLGSTLRPRIHKTKEEKHGEQNEK
jgi:hypothetical protein